MYGNDRDGKVVEKQKEIFLIIPEFDETTKFIKRNDGDGFV